MRCKRVLEQLHAMSKGEAAPEVRREIEAHLNECERCRSAMARADLLACVLPRAQAPPVPAGFAERVMAAARQREPAETDPAWNPLRWWRRSSTPMHFAAAAALLIGLAVGLIMGREVARSIGSPPAPEQFDPLGAYQIDFLSEAPKGSLADTYLSFVMTDSEGGR